MIRMENYGQITGQQQHDSTTTNSSNNRNKNDDNTRTDLPPSYAAAAAAMPLLVTTATNHHHYDDYFQSASVASSAAADKNPTVDGVIKSEISQPPRFYNYPWLMSSHHHHQPSDSRLHHHQLQLHRRHRTEEGGGGSDDGGVSNRSGGGVDGEDASNEVESLKAKIVAHPQYSKLLQAYADCQKVGAPPEVAARLTSILHDFQTRNHQTSSSSATITISSSSKDPELDQFMEAYYDMLVKYKEELTRPVQEAIEFMSRIESQLNNLLSSSNASAARHPPPRLFTSDDKSEGNVASSEDEQENSGGETELPEIDPRAEDRELKTHLLKKYGGYLSSLKQELSKKRKKGKLPKEARQKLLSWWELHYKWPYPSESEKVALAEATGLDQKQINNWFINQRKRHWKPSEDMQFMVMDGIHPQTSALYMEGHYMGNGPYRFGT